MEQNTSMKRAANKAFFAIVALFGAFALCLAMLGLGAGRAYAEADSLTTASSPELETQASSIRYIAIFGADTWVTNTAPASDLTALARVDLSSGTVNLMSFPRDMQYKNMKKLFPNAEYETLNEVFRYTFKSVINDEWASTEERIHAGNFDEAIGKSAENTCKALSDITGLSISEYVVVDQYTLQTIVDMLGGVTVDIPVPIAGYRLYSDGSYHDVNGGKTGLAKLDGWNVMISARAREPYSLVDATQYLDTCASAILSVSSRNESTGATYTTYWFNQDASRQFLNRRTLAALVDQALAKKGSGSWSFVWDQLVGGGLMWTNLSKSDVKAIGNGLLKAKNANKLVMYGASVVSPIRGWRRTLNGCDQWIIPVKTSIDPEAGTTVKQIKDTVAQFKAGKPMTAGFGYETLIGAAKGTTKKVGGITYKVLSNYAVSVVGIPNKKSVVIPATVKIGGKYYNVAALGAKSMQGSKVRTVTLGSKVKKISANAFKGSKATKIIAKTTLLTKSKVKGSLKGSAVKYIKVSVAKSKKADTIKRYKTYFTKKNAGCTKAPKVY